MTKYYNYLGKGVLKWNDRSVKAYCLCSISQDWNDFKDFEIEFPDCCDDGFPITKEDKKIIFDDIEAITANFTFELNEND